MIGREERWGKGERSREKGKEREGGKRGRKEREERGRERERKTFVQTSMADCLQILKEKYWCWATYQRTDSGQDRVGDSRSSLRMTWARPTHQSRLWLPVTMVIWNTELVLLLTVWKCQSKHPVAVDTTCQRLSVSQLSQSRCTGEVVLPLTRRVVCTCLL